MYIQAGSRGRPGDPGRHLGDSYDDTDLPRASVVNEIVCAKKRDI